MAIECAKERLDLCSNNPTISETEHVARTRLAVAVEDAEERLARRGRELGYDDDHVLVALVDPRLLADARRAADAAHARAVRLQTMRYVRPVHLRGRTRRSECCSCARSPPG
jgi:predicted metalloprotease